jgi:hypothetical protein
MKNRSRKLPVLVALVVQMMLLPRLSWSQTTTASGEFIVEPPTLLSLGFEWKISGDDNRNARVESSYRRKGESQWQKGLPLLRMQHEWVNGGADQFSSVPPTPSNPNGVAPNPWHYDTGNMFAGSILNLEPDTEYECRLTLIDPDGVTGAPEKTATVRTRKEPQPAAGGRTYHVYPIGWEGPKTEPAFTGLGNAYFMGQRHSDHQNVFPPRVQAGDTILVHAGLYIADRFHYMYGVPHPGFLALNTPIDGTYYLTANGTPDKPIVIKAAGDGEAIFDGDGNHNLFNLMAASYNYFEGITVRNTDVAFLLGLKSITGASGFTLKHSRIYDIGRAVQTEWSGSKDFYIADNVIIGRHDPAKMMSWTGAIWTKFPGFPELLLSEEGIKVYGQGHVVAYNYIANWHDAIDVATYGEPDGSPNPIQDRLPVAIDFYNNDMYNMGDNCIESDGGVHNIRVFRNRCANSAQGALSAQPMMGGPVYFYQNIVYNAPGTGGVLKYADTPAGVLTYQNTFIGEATLGGPSSNVHHLNNLFLGAQASASIFSLSTYTNYSSSDYNGFRPNPKAAASFVWNSPPFEMAADYDYKKKLISRRFKTLADYSKATGQETHSILVDYNIFENVKMPDESDPQRLYNPEDYDFRLKAGSAAIDAGVVLPSINDGFTGRAPDLGALELGKPVPHYGPRTDAPGAVPQDRSALRSWSGPLRPPSM